MMPRIERHAAPAKRDALTRRRKGFAPTADARDPQLALAYSNGYVTVEISQEALDAYVDMTGDVPLPVVEDPETGDRRTYDARNKVSVVYDAAANLREISKRGSDGLYVRINFAEDPSEEPAEDHYEEPAEDQYEDPAEDQYEDPAEEPADRP